MPTSTGASPGRRRRTTTRPSPTYTEAIRLDPEDADAAYRRAGGNCAWAGKKGEYDKAIADFNEAIRLDPKDAIAYNNRGNAWSDKKEYDKAIADYTEAIRLDPETACAYCNRGIAWIEQEGVRQGHRRLHRGHPARPEVRRRLQQPRHRLAAKKEYDKAIADYTEAIRLDPKDAAAYCNRGNAWSDKEEYDKAIADFDRGHPARPQERRRLSRPRHRLVARRRSTTRPSPTSTEAIRLDPKDRRAPTRDRGHRLDATKKEYDKAIADY